MQLPVACLPHPALVPFGLIDAVDCGLSFSFRGCDVCLHGQLRRPVDAHGLLECDWCPQFMPCLILLTDSFQYFPWFFAVGPNSIGELLLFCQLVVYSQICSHIPGSR